MSESPGGRFETFDANERFVVVRDDEGYGGLADGGSRGEGEPLERFTDDDVGYESAAATMEGAHEGGATPAQTLARSSHVVVTSVSLATSGSCHRRPPSRSRVYGGDQRSSRRPERGPTPALRSYLLSSPLVRCLDRRHDRYVILWLESSPALARPFGFRRKGSGYRAPVDFRKGAKLDPTQVEDRRGMRGGRGMAVGGGAGVVGVIVVLLITLLGGENIDLERAPVARGRDRRRAAAAGRGASTSARPARTPSRAATAA